MIIHGGIVLEPEDVGAQGELRTHDSGLMAIGSIQSTVEASVAMPELTSLIDSTSRLTR